MRTIAVVVVAALAAALAPLAAVPGSTAVTPPTPAAAGHTEVVAGEFLAGPEADLSQLPEGTEVRRLGGGWRLVVHTGAGTSTSVAEGLARTVGGRVVPNAMLFPAPSQEPLFGDQWALDNTGQTGGTPGADIDAPAAWDITTGDPTVVVAVLDTGIDLDHPDLADRVRVNPGEVAGNGVDDDGNGFVDDVGGWDFVDGDADPSDRTGHGTQVAGVIAAGANGVGIAGVAPDVTLMPIRVCDSGCPLSDILGGLAYAAANGAVIVNMSFGGTGPFFDPLEEMLDGEASGLLAVAAAGNDAADVDATPHYPAAYTLPNLLSVAATDADDKLTDYSNYGVASIDLGAPGHLILTTTDGGGYGLASGTSFAAPHVAGAAALLATLRPEATPAELAGFLLGDVEPAPTLAGRTVTGGRLDAAGALDAAATPVAHIAIPPFVDSVPVDVRFDGSASKARVGDGIADHVWAFSDGVTAAGETVVRSFTTAAAISATLTVFDGGGRMATATETVVLRDEGGATISPADAIGTAPLTIGLAATVPGTAVAAAAWGFGDGSASSEVAPVHTYDHIGVYEVGVEVTGANGGIFTGAAPIHVGAAFTDTSTSVFADDVVWLSATGITLGCNPPLNDRFCPDQQVTRGQFAAMMVRGLDLPPGPEAFVDDNDSIFENDINALAAAGITRGCNPPTNDRFCPTRMITRGEMAAFLVRGLDLPPGPEAFVDDNDSIFENDINALAAAGITRGCNPPTNDRFCPTRMITRGEMAAFLRRAGI